MTMPEEKHILFRKLSKTFAEGFLFMFTEKTRTQELLEWLETHRYLCVFDLVLGSATDLKILKKKQKCQCNKLKNGQNTGFSYSFKREVKI